MSLSSATLVNVLSKRSSRDLAATAIAHVDPHLKLARSGFPHMYECF